MKILAVEFSSIQRSVAAVWPGRVIGKPVVSERGTLPDPPDGAPRAMGYQFAETVSLAAGGLAMADEVLREARWEREQVECVAVGLGPGSYTGIRAAIALAQGWQLARPVRIIGISSADVLASQAHADGSRSQINVIIGAQRNEFHVARYDLSETGPREMDAMRLMGLEEVRRLEQSGEIVLGPEVKRWFATGRMLFPAAGVLGALAMKRTDSVSGEKLEPLYLRETTFIKARPPGS